MKRIAVIRTGSTNQETGNLDERGYDVADTWRSELEARWGMLPGYAMTTPDQASRDMARQVIGHRAVIEMFWQLSLATRSEADYTAFRLGQWLDSKTGNDLVIVVNHGRVGEVLSDLIRRSSLKQGIGPRVAAGGGVTATLADREVTNLVFFFQPASIDLMARGVTAYCARAGT